MATSSLENILLVWCLLPWWLVSGDQQPGNIIQLSGTRDLEQWTDLISNGLSLLSSGLIAALLVTGALYLAGAGGILDRRRTDRRVELQNPYGYQDNREDGIFQHVERIISYLSVDSLQGVISSIKHEILGSLSSVREDGLQRVDDLNNEISDSLDVVGGGSKVEDCLLQAICYLTPDDEKSEAGESRKNKDKQKRKEEKKRAKKEKKKAKKNKNKNKDSDFDDYEDEIEIEDEEEEEEGSVEEESDVKIEEEDCDVFQCDMVRYGYQAFQLYDKVQTLRQKFDSLAEE